MNGWIARTARWVAGAGLAVEVGAAVTGNTLVLNLACVIALGAAVIGWALPGLDGDR